MVKSIFFTWPTILLLHTLSGLVCLSAGDQITPEELRDPDIHAACFWGSCVSPPYGKAYCFDTDIEPMPETVEEDAPYNTLFLRGKLVSKTRHSAIFLMQEKYAVSWGFFYFLTDVECDTTFCSLEELRNADPDISAIRSGDKICIIPLESYERGRQLPVSVRAIETTDVTVLGCSRRGGSANIRRRYSWF